MGVCCSELTNIRNFDNENELDKIIIISNAFMKNKISENQIEQLFPNFLFNQLIEEKSDINKTRHFFKWVNMTTQFKQIVFSIDVNDIINSYKIQKNNNKKNIELIDENNENITFKNKGVSYTENGLRNYYNNNKIIFENKVLKCPPAAFRWISWEILCLLPESRDLKNYQKLIISKINEKKKDEILQEIEETIENKCIMFNEIKACLFRLLKSLTIIDNEIIILKGISYIMAYLLIISDLDELNTFYIIISLLSKTFSDKFGIRGFYIREQPLLKACNSIFQKYLDKYFPELSEHFQEISLPLSSWISFWIQMCYINIFPNYLVLRIWDFFLVYGISFLLSMGLSIVEYLYEDLINNDNPDDILELFKKLNPNLKSSYKRFSNIDYNIEDLISNAIKNYPISNDEIFIELQALFPNYNNNFKYVYIDNQNFDKRSLLSVNEKETSTYDRNILENDNTEKDRYTNNSNNKINILNFLNSSEESYSILVENEIENIDLSISQYKNKKILEDYYSENSCEEIEDENIFINEHIKDLMNKQISLDKKPNFL